MDQLCPPKSVDPMTVLPRELAETILDYLSFRQRMNACLVSKQWTQFIRSIPNQWRHLDLSGARRKVRSAFVSRVINVARSKMSAATLSNLYDFDKTLVALIKHCPLTDLTLLECGLQSENLTTMLRPAKALRSLKIDEGSHLNSHELLRLTSALSDRLEILECSITGRQAPTAYHVRCEKLTSLTIHFDDSCNHSRFFHNIPDHFPSLEMLSVHQDRGVIAGVPTYDLRPCEKLRHLDFDVKGLGLQQLRIPRSLTCFKLNTQCSAAIPPFHLPLLNDLMVRGATSLREVEYLLGAHSAPGFPEATHEPVLAQPTKLHRLTITTGSCTGGEDAEQLFCHPRLKSLTDLRLGWCSGIDDRVVETIVSAKLEKLDHVGLLGAGVTGVGVKQLVSSLNLKTLDLSQCRSVSPDAVEWARAKGVIVKYWISDDTAGGRKLRY